MTKENVACLRSREGIPLTYSNHSVSLYWAIIVYALSDIAGNRLNWSLT